MTPTAFQAELARLTAQLAGRPLDSVLDTWLNAEHGATSDAWDLLHHWSQRFDDHFLLAKQLVDDDTKAPIARADDHDVETLFAPGQAHGMQLLGFFSLLG